MSLDLDAYRERVCDVLGDLGYDDPVALARATEATQNVTRHYVDDVTALVEEVERLRGLAEDGGQGEPDPEDDRVLVYRDKAGEWRWTRLAGNNRKVATSGEGYRAQGGALRAAAATNPDLPVYVTVRMET